MTKNIQLELFDESYKKYSWQCRDEKMVMSVDSLICWKRRIFEYQQHSLNNSPQQKTLFKIQDNYGDPFSINPFELRTHPFDFYRFPDIGDSVCIYFVLDKTKEQIILYIGETKRSPKQRWKEIHDCKEYLDNYISLNRQYKLDIKLKTCFCWSVPEKRSSRLRMEENLIKKWKPPFNKESWQLWGQPFGKVG